MKVLRMRMAHVSKEIFSIWGQFKKKYYSLLFVDCVIDEVKKDVFYFRRMVKRNVGDVTALDVNNPEVFEVVWDESFESWEVEGTRHEMLKRFSWSDEWYVITSTDVKVDKTFKRISDGDEIDVRDFRVFNFQGDDAFDLEEFNSFEWESGEIIEIQIENWFFLFEFVELFDEFFFKLFRTDVGELNVAKEKGKLLHVFDAVEF